MRATLLRVGALWGQLRDFMLDLVIQGHRWPLRKKIAVGVGIACLSGALRLTVFSYFGDQGIYVLFFPAVAFSSVIGGIVGGATASITAIALASIVINHTAISYSLIFLASAIFTSVIGGALQNGMVAQAATTEELDALLRALERSEVRYRSVVEATSVITWSCAPSGRLTEPQPAWLAFTGQTPDEMLDDGWRKAIHPDDISRLMDRWDTALKAGRQLESEHRVRRHDGQWRWINLLAVPIRSKSGAIVEWFGTDFDITERKLSEGALEASRQNLQRFIQNAPAALAMFDRDMRYLTASDRWKSDCGIGGIDVVGRSHYDLFPTIPERWKHAHREGMAGRVMRADEDMFERDDGTRLWVRWEVQPWRHADETVGGIIIYEEDITDRKTVEHRNELLLKEVNHRSKNLLAVVQSIAQTTAKDNPPEQFAESFSERIRGLAASHELLVQAEWTGVDVNALVQAQLPHFSTLIGSRLIIQGPAIMLTPSAAQAIGMAIHELGTNSAKYGALSTERGVVDVAWHINPVLSDDDARFTIHWIERDGPPVLSPPTRQGFGYTIIVEVPEHLLNATVSLSFLQRGVEWSLCAPAARVIASPEGQG